MSELSWTPEEEKLANQAAAIEKTQPKKYRDDEQPECFCAYCGKPMRIYIGYDMTDIQCENCRLTNATLVCTDIEELVKHMSMRPNNVLTMQSKIERLTKRELTNCATILHLRDELKLANAEIKRLKGGEECKTTK